jgi:hypothetical protein|tara:strand:- start:205 stop:414 length:210 start_codon:yes stop_codon:yes gene_type:complete
MNSFNEQTPERIAQHYSAMLDSKTLIDSLEGTEDVDELATISRNVEHIKIMVVKEFWTDEDMSIFNKFL